MRLSIEHRTSYSYGSSAAYSCQSLRLTPQSFNGQQIVSWQIDVSSFDGEPETSAGDVLASIDGFGNSVHLVSVHASHSRLVIAARGTVETSDQNGVVNGLSEHTPIRCYLKETAQTKPVDAIRELARAAAGITALDRLHSLSALVRDRIDYVIGATDAKTNAAEALAASKGVCQDHAHVFIAAARSLGFPARYVTGYFVTDDGSVADAHHAWAEAYAEDLGWIGFDVANRLCPTDRYVRLAAGLDADYAAPVRGSRRGGHSEKLSVSVDVQQQSVQQ